MSTVEEAIRSLNKQWYNALVQGLGVDPSMFQLAQGSTSLGYISDNIWEIFDAIPPVSVNNYYDPATHNSLAQAYSGVINNLVAQDNEIKKVLGNKYAKWVAYKKDPEVWKEIKGDTYREKLLKVFDNWALMNLDVGEYDRAVTTMKQVNIITVAMDQLVEANGQFAYTAGANSLQEKIDEGQAKSVTLDSNTTSKDTSHSWGKSSRGGLFSFFVGGSSGSWDVYFQDTTKISIKLDVKFKKVANLGGRPYTIPRPGDADLIDYTPWWNSAALKTAKDNNNNKVWKHGAPTWEQTFGPEGNLRYLTAALIVVDGIESTMTSKVSIAKNEQESFRKSMNRGFWPFYVKHGEGGFDHKVSFTDEGYFQVKSSSPEGNPNVIGVLVDPIDKTLG